MIEQWTRWEPIQHVSSIYYTMSIIDDHEGCKITLVNNSDKKKHELLLNFENTDAFRIISNNLTIQSTKIAHYTTDYDWPFFKITNSHYLQWLGYESSGLIYTRNFLHFKIITSNLILDIISPLEPLIEFVDQPNLDK